MTTTMAGALGRRDCRCLRARHRHGTRGAWLKDGCRCLPCGSAAALALQDRRRGIPGATADPGMWVPACGVIRRLEALHRVGWTTGDLADHMGVTYDAVRVMRTYKSHRRSVWLTMRVAELYDRLWDQRPTPRNTGHKVNIRRTVNAAKAAGWLPPLAWDDDEIDNPAALPRHDAEDPGSHDYVDQVAVDAACAGHPPRALTSAERHQAVSRLEQYGLSAMQIAARLQISDRTVQRYRATERGAA